jgi:hypothetical protein
MKCVRILSVAALTAGLAAVAPTAAQAAPTVDGRAPSASAAHAATPQPLTYRVRLASDDTGARWSGHQEIVFRNTGRTVLDLVWLRLWGNGVDGCAGTPDLTLSGFAGGVQGTPDLGCTALPVRLNRPLSPGATTAVSFDLTINVPERADRFGRVGAYSFLGNALPVLAVKDEQGWQLPPYVANAESFYTLTSSFLVSLDHPDGLAVPATGSVLGETRHAGRTTTRIAAPLVRDFAWAAGPFRSVTGRTATGVRLRTWYTPEVTDDTARSVQDDVARTLQYAAGEYGAYPYPEFDAVIGGFEGFSGMEYPTFVLTEPASLPAVHETAHQWWYALVGNDEYHDPWLDESLAQYTTNKVLGIPDYCAEAPFWFSDTMRIDAGMDYYASRYDEYVPGIYGDGACMFSELEGLIGADAMRTGLRRYFSAQRFGIGRPAELRAALQSATPVDLAPFWERWRNTARCAENGRRRAPAFGR